MIVVISVIPVIVPSVLLFKSSFVRSGGKMDRHRNCFLEQKLTVTLSDQEKRHNEALGLIQLYTSELEEVMVNKLELDRSMKQLKRERASLLQELILARSQLELVSLTQQHPRKENARKPAFELSASTVETLEELNTEYSEVKELFLKSLYPNGGLKKAQAVRIMSLKTEAESLQQEIDNLAQMKDNYEATKDRVKQLEQMHEAVASDA
eukprot:m.51806 g.51806  ORF g.51806 m.51806 type:complete len:209 (+) comp7583_c0_seq1:60-686(+)